MEHIMEVKVEVISNEMVKPSLLLSSHPKTFTLSFLDQIFPAFHIPVLLFYPGLIEGTPTPHGGGEVDLGGLKTSLSQTLDHFYPLAGRLLDESTVSCNDQGIPFIQTEVNCHLSDVIASSQKLKLLSKFLPPQQLQTVGPRPISDVVSIPIQVNAFKCGGVVIGCYMLHKLLDAASLGTFFKHWSALASKSDNDLNLIQPDFEATIDVFPPLREGVEQVLVPDLYTDTKTDSDTERLLCGKSYNFTTVVKSYTFNAISLTKLKAKAASQVVPTPTRFEALAGFVWEQLMLVAATTTPNMKDDNNNSTLSFSVNMRPRMRPPLPNQSMGNIMTNAIAQANISNSKLQELVQEIHSALSHIDNKIQTVYQGKDNVQVLCNERKAESQGVMNKDKGLYYQLSSWCNNGLSETDFGFGKPTSIVPIDGRPLPPTLRNFIFFTDYRHPISGDTGIEAWLFLEEKQMQVLESTPLFLAFASPY